MIFTDKVPVKVKNPASKETYKAGELTVVSLPLTRKYVDNELVNFATDRWGRYDRDTGRFEKAGRFSVIEQGVFFGNYSKMKAVLTADMSGKLTGGQALEMAMRHPDYFGKCYEAAIEQNPSLAPDYRTVQPEVVAASEGGEEGEEGEGAGKEPELLSDEALAEKN